MFKKIIPLFFVLLCYAYKMSIAGGLCNLSFTDSVTQLCTAPGLVSFSTTVLSSNGPVSFVWNFGDTSLISQEPNPEHSYSSFTTYHCQVIGTDTADCSDTINNTIVIYGMPVANFDGDTTFQPCPPFTVPFINNSTNATRYLWRFEDYGYTDTSIHANPIHFYFFPGTYAVTLIAYNHIGCADTLSIPDAIRLRGPKGQFTVDKDSGAAPITIHISATFQDVMHFDCGDSITYYNPGTYYPICTLTDSFSCSVQYPIDTIVVKSIESVLTIQDLPVKVYPNPVNDKFVIETDGLDLSNANLQLIDNIGREIKPPYSISNNKIFFDVSILLPGMYIISINTYGNIYRQKIIKE